MSGYKKRLGIGVLVWVGLLVLQELAMPLAACTTFCLQNQGSGVYGRNYDWETDSCLIMVNKRNVSKQSFLGENKAKWVSKYGSVTFNQYGREYPLGGMNEVGLVVECMWLVGTKYPVRDERPELPVLQWIQYQLDTAANISDVIKSDKKVRIINNSEPLHFLVSDYRGRVAVIEFLGGQMKSYVKNDLPQPVLANDTYEGSVKAMAKYKGKEEAAMQSRSADSNDRFFRANYGVLQWEKSKKKDAVEHAFGMLKDLSWEKTMFSIVYDPLQRRIYYRTRVNLEIRTINVGAFDYSCKKPVKILDLRFKPRQEHNDMTGDFTDYTMWANYSLVKRSFSETKFLQNKTEEEIKAFAQYPETLRCQQ